MSVFSLCFSDRSEFGLTDGGDKFESKIDCHNRKPTISFFYRELSLSSRIRRSPPEIYKRFFVCLYSDHRKLIPELCGLVFHVL